jgi:parallel beta-helix repeat protein
VHDGVHIQPTTQTPTQETVKANVIESNTGDGVDLGTTNTNVVTANTVRGNAACGIKLDGTDFNQVTANTVVGNGTTSKNGGIVLRGGADSNVVDGNTINGNVDGCTDVIRCLLGTGNTGSNVTPACR